MTSPWSWQELHLQHHDALRLPDALRELARAMRPVPHILWTGDYTPLPSPSLPGESLARLPRDALVGGISLQALQAHAYLARSKGIHAEAVPGNGALRLRQCLRTLARQPAAEKFLPPSRDIPAFTGEDLRLALRSGRGLRVDLQPQYDLQTRKIVGAEALIRWWHVVPLCVRSGHRDTAYLLSSIFLPVP